jgi:hypothetical protein
MIPGLEDGNAVGLMICSQWISTVDQHISRTSGWGVLLRLGGRRQCWHGGGGAGLDGRLAIHVQASRHVSLLADRVGQRQNDGGILC